MNQRNCGSRREDHYDTCLVILDINECQKLGGQDGHHCSSPNSVCINTDGSYECHCKDGFEEVEVAEDREKLICKPVDACMKGGQSVCTDHSTCVNTGPGTFKCVCDIGYEGEGQNHCKRKLPSGLIQNTFFGELLARLFLKFVKYIFHFKVLHYIDISCNTYRL